MCYRVYVAWMDGWIWTCIYPLSHYVHIIDYYLLKVLWCKLLSECTDSHSYNITVEVFGEKHCHI